MKFVSFSTPELPEPHPGIAQGDDVLDVDLAAVALNLRGFDTLNAVIEHDAQAQELFRAIMERAAGRAFSEVKVFAETGAARKLDEVQLSAPIPHPHRNVMCLGLNYADHAQETAALRGRSGDAPDYPIFFTKAPTAVNGPFGDIVIDPAVSTAIDWEAELGVIIGKRGKNIRAEDALDYVFGYTVINDVTARDLQSRHKQYFKGKSIDGYCPMGPWIVSADEIPDPQRLAVRLRVNGVTKQDSNTSMMVFSVRDIIASLSLGMTLEPGDIIATGTPSGVGFARNPPQYLQPGDVMETEIEGIGTLRNHIVRV